MKNKRKIRNIGNGYIATDSGGREYYYSTLGKVTDILKHDLEQTVDTFGEFVLEYSIKRIESKDRLIANYKDALIMIVGTECILDHNTVELMREIAQDALS